MHSLIQLCMYVCVCIKIYIYIYVYTHTRLCVCIRCFSLLLVSGLLLTARIRVCTVL